jgi:tRNA pseudouridine55 synthase
LYKRQISGVLLLDKPPGLTSNAALQKVKRLVHAEKAGHTGTLDPLATGLLPICLGEATKFSQGLLDSGKTYQAVVKLGETTATGDAEGEILSIQAVDVSRARVEQALSGLLGSISQIPPMYSALKHRGKPLYAYAREGIQVERAPRQVRIESLRLHNITGQEIKITIHCSKGTYIRVLAEDLGKMLGCGAYLKALRRTEVGPFRLNQALTLPQLEAMNLEQRDASLLPVDCLVQALPEILLEDKNCSNFLRGNAISQAMTPICGLARIYNMKQRFIGLGEITAEGKIKPKRLLSVCTAQ